MALRAANGLLDGVTALLVLLAVVWSGYALWDNSRVYAAADNVQAGLLAFKPQPQEDNSLSFGQLRDINPDVCGWLTLDGTAIDYPVVQGESNFTYLNTDVYGSFALAGSIFLDVDCDADFSGRYSLLYGHHMENGRMFGDLDKYKDGAFFRQNTTGTLTLPGGSYRLEVLACLVVPCPGQVALGRRRAAPLCGGECPSDGCTGPPCAGKGAGRSAVPGDGYLLGGVHRRADGGAGPDGTNVRPAKRKGGELIMRRLPKMAAALLAAALAVSAALPALAADQRAELELEASVRCTGEAADETLTVRLTALDGAPMPEGCDDEAELDFPARDCRDADDKTLTKTFDTIVYTAPGIYEYTVTQDAGGRKRADYDDTVFSLKVMVAWDTDGELKGHVSVRRDGDDGAKTELLFKNSYRSTDPLPPPVTPPYVPDKPTPTPKPVEQPGEITVIRPPTPSAEMPDEVIPAAEPEPVGTLIQTGQRLWPVPVLAGGGIALVAVGLWLSRKRRHDA